MAMNAADAPVNKRRCMLPSYKEPLVKTLEACALNACRPKDLFNYLSECWGTGIQKQYWQALLNRLSLKEMEKLSCSLPWDHPAARQMDFYIHKKRMKGMYFKGSFFH